MSTTPQLRNVDPEDEAQLLDTIDRWVDKEVKPIVKEYDHADRYPAETVEQMKELGLFGATISPEYGGLGLPAGTYAKIVMRISRDWMAVTGIFNSHLMLALAVEKFGTNGQKETWLPQARDRRGARRPCADGARCRNGPAGDPHDRQARRRRLRHQRHQDVDLQRHRGQLLRPAGEDRSQGRAAPQGHEPVHRPEAGGLPRRPQAGEARLQVDRFRRAGVRGLPRRRRTT